jgi:hypothetical protein
MRREVITFNKEANKRWDKPVFYLFYDDEENFVNIVELTAKIENYQSNNVFSLCRDLFLFLCSLSVGAVNE